MQINALIVYRKKNVTAELKSEHVSIFSNEKRKTNGAQIKAG
jgi:hypothetical protein